jgi:exonuclease SbcD
MVVSLPDPALGAVRLLHTSDWHLGSAIRGHPRGDDHEAVLQEIVSIAGAARPDLILHTGDLFDGARPPMTEFGRAIRVLRRLAAIAPVVVLAGNHDSSVALEVLGVALADDNIRVLHKPCLPEEGAVTTYRSAAGVGIRLAALPFVHANRVLTDFGELCEPNATYNDSLRRIIGHLTSACLDGYEPGHEVAVFASHLHVTGARTSSEMEIHVSTNYATDPAHLDPAFGYLAFGHIHIPQPVAGGRGQYAGSVLEVDFGELGETKRVVIADLEPGRPTAITSVPLHEGRRLHRLRAPLADLAAHMPSVAGGLVEVTIAPGAGDEGPIDPTDPIVLGDLTFDTLSQAVRALLPDTTVVTVIDGRRPDVELASGSAGADDAETLEQAFERWLASAGQSVLNAKPRANGERVLELFGELRTSLGADPNDPAAIAEAAALEAAMPSDGRRP